MVLTIGVLFTCGGGPNCHTHPAAGAPRVGALLLLETGSCSGWPSPRSSRWRASSVRAKLYKGDCAVVGRKSDDSLYREELATYGEADTFDHEAAIGFIKLHGLSQQTQARLQLGASGPAPVLPRPDNDESA